jgi:hypothetical protein
VFARRNDSGPGELSLSAKRKINSCAIRKFNRLRKTQNMRSSRSILAGGLLVNETANGAFSETVAPAAQTTERGDE